MDARATTSAASVKDVKTTTYVWPDPQGVGERAGLRGLPRPRAGPVRQQPAERVVRLDQVRRRPAAAGHRATCAAKASCAPRTPRPASAPARGAGRRVRLGPGQGRQAVRDLGRARPRLQHPDREAEGLLDALLPDDDLRQQHLLLEGAGDQRGRRADTVAGDTQRLRATVAVQALAGLPAGRDHAARWRTTSTTSGPRCVTPPATCSRSATNSEFTEGDPTTEKCHTASTTYTPGFEGDRCIPAQGTVVYWRVRAIDAPRNPAVNGVYSDTGRVRLRQRPDRCRSRPANNSTVSVPTFRWQPSPDANRYKITLTGPAGTVTRRPPPCPGRRPSSSPPTATTRTPAATRTSSRGGSRRSTATASGHRPTSPGASTSGGSASPQARRR